MQIFISHTHADVGLVDVLRGFLKDIFDDAVTLKCSSSAEPSEGIPVGTSWLGWIQQQVRDSDLTIVLLTAESVSKPWLLWETGAVTGVSLASGRGKGDGFSSGGKLIPIMVGIQAEQIPSPLQSLQSIYGDGKKIKLLIQRINQLVEYSLGDGQLGKLFDASIDKYLDNLGKALRGRPLPLDEPAVMEWLARLDKLRAEKRMAEVAHYHKALILAFTSKSNRENALLDLRLHRCLGEMYLDSKGYESAIKEFRKAIELTHGKDLYLLHKLGLALLQNKQLDSARKVLEDIAQLDPEAQQSNPEIAGFAGRYFRERWEQDGVTSDLERARDAYRDALDAGERVGRRSYYLAGNVGQLSLLLGEKDVARDAFKRSREFVETSHEQSIWAYASLATACLALGHEDAGLAALDELCAQQPSDWAIDSIHGGLVRIRDGLGIPDETYQRWRSKLYAEQ